MQQRCRLTLISEQLFLDGGELDGALGCRLTSISEQLFSVRTG